MRRIGSLFKKYVSRVVCVAKTKTDVVYIGCAALNPERETEPRTYRKNRLLRLHNPFLVEQKESYIRKRADSRTVVSAGELFEIYVGADFYSAYNKL